MREQGYLIQVRWTYGSCDYKLTDKGKAAYREALDTRVPDC